MWTMARVIGKLTMLAVRQARERGLYGDSGGLFLQITETGAKSWVFRYKVRGRHRVMGLGPLHTFSLAEAREKAIQCRKARFEGIDPIDARRAGQAQVTLDAAKARSFDECAEAYITAHRPDWRNAKHATQWTSTLAAYASPVFGSLPVQAIDMGLVMKALEPIWTTKPETASRVRARIEAILDWAKVKGFRQGENPARWRGHLESLLPNKAKVREVEHHPALPWAQIGTFMAALREQQGVAARALEFTILTTARTKEVTGAPWGEIDLGERLWTVPKERMKGNRVHRVPLSNAALSIIEDMQEVRVGDFAFPGATRGRPLGTNAMTQVLRRMGRGDFTVHGFRSTFSDWVSECTGFPREEREMALAHRVGDKVEEAYRRGDMFEKRRHLAEAWARFCAEPSPAGRVVPIRPLLSA